MSNSDNELEKLVPGLDACGKIPGTDFKDSILVWRDTGERRNCEDCPTVLHVYKLDMRSKDMEDEHYPAPTAQEILRRMENVAVHGQTAENGLYMFKVTSDRGTRVEARLADAALALWMLQYSKCAACRNYKDAVTGDPYCSHMGWWISDTSKQCGDFIALRE